MKLPNSIEALIERLSELPGIGPRQATRLALYLAQQGKQALRTLAENIDNLGNLKLCANCFLIHEGESNLCSICADPKRNPRIIMIVEKETDLLSVERTGKFTGRYLIIGAIGKIGILEEWQKLRLSAFKAWVERELKGQAPQSSTAGQADEIIVGFNPSTHGDWHASSLAKELSGLAKTITRLGRGLPTGGEIEFADDDTLSASLERRG